MAAARAVAAINLIIVSSLLALRGLIIVPARGREPLTQIKKRPSVRLRNAVCSRRGFWPSQ